MWDMSLAAMMPGLRVAAPRDALTLADELAEALDVSDGPTVLRFPKGAVPPDVPGRAGGFAVTEASPGSTSSPNRRTARTGTCCWSRSARSARWRSTPPSGWRRRASA